MITDSALDPTIYGERYLNKLKHWEKFVSYLCQKCFLSTYTPPTADEQRFCGVISGCRHLILLGKANTETIDDAFDLYFNKAMSSLIVTETNENIRKRMEPPY